MRETLARQLTEMADPGYAQFQRRIVSDTHYPILGVRVPLLRMIGKASAKEFHQLLQEARFETYEETLAVGLAVAYGNCRFSQKAGDLRVLLPRLDSWGMTDTIVPTLKLKGNDLADAWVFSGECLDSGREYICRFGIVMMMDYFLDTDKFPDVMERILDLDVSHLYYVQMAAAWLLAEAAVTHSDVIEQALSSGELNQVVHNLAIRKIRESRRIPVEWKRSVASMVRKGG